MFIEHIIYSLLPDIAAKRRQRIGEARSAFLTIPRQMWQLLPEPWVLKVPEPHHRIEKQTQRGGSLRTLSFEGLRLLSAEKLLGIFERILDAPSSGISTDNLLWRQGQIRRYEEIVFFLLCRVSADDQHNRSFGDVIPYNLSRPDQTFSLFSAFDGDNLLEIPDGFDKFERFWQQFASDSFASASGFFLRGQLEYDRVLSHTRYDVNPPQIAVYQSRIKAIAMTNKASAGQPGGDFDEHAFGKVDMAGAVFETQTHIDRQSNGFAAPGWINPQCQHNQIEAVGINNAGYGANRVSPIGSAGYLSARPVKERIVQVQMYCASRTESLYQPGRQQTPKLGKRPLCATEEPMECVVRPVPKSSGEWYYARYGSSAGTKNPSGHQSSKYFCRRDRKYRKKMIDNCPPCRCNILCLHTDLHVLMVLPPSTSVGQYVCVQFSWNMAA
jgi:hypothetical protein